jgi:hypothetical protein
MRRSPLRRRGRPQRRTRLTRRTRPRRTALARRAPIAPASHGQRAKVTGKRCVACGATARIDPAHLVPRALGGCDEPECVVALCRPHHRAYDRGELDLLPYLEPSYRIETAHAVMHLGLIGALRRLTRRRAVGEQGQGCD